MKKFIKWTLLFLSLIILAAVISLLWYDYKQMSWYNEPASIQKKKFTDTNTVVCILATVHQSNPNYNADSIVYILNQFQPDFILTEEDTLLFETVHKSYSQTFKKPLFARLGQSFGFGGSEENEARSVRKFKISDPSVEIRPFDYEGRNDYYEKNSTFSKEIEVNNMLERLASNHSLTGEQERIWKAYVNINDTLKIKSSQTPYFINQQAYYSLTERRQDYQYHNVAEIVNSNDSLKSWRDFYRTNANFWDTRNRKMAEHIANFIRKYPLKRYMVLTGSMHKYYLLKELEPLQAELKFKIKEYYE